MFELTKSIIVAGTGKNVGKTSFVRALLRKLIAFSPIAVKITPHFHTSDPGIILIESENFIISKENKTNTGKDTSNFLLDGAKEVYFIQVKDEYLNEAFIKFCEIVDCGRFIVFESASLIKHVKPGLFFLITDNSGQNKNQDLTQYADLLIINNKMDKDFKNKDIDRLIMDFVKKF
ncbi:MAG: hypothetical protein JXR58_13985 [Bacteroidales bacterium]|nr:hypothetical protein [Bacteroidales bacterium]